MNSCRFDRKRFTSELAKYNPKRIAEKKISKENAEKQVVKSLTELIDSQKEPESNIVVEILVEKIVARLLESDTTLDVEKCYSTAKKMAAFVADVMKETYRREGKFPSPKGSKSSLPGIPENKILETAISNWKKKVTEKTKTNQLNNKRQTNSGDSKSTTNKRQTLKTGQEVKTIPKKEREKLNSWLDEVSESTDKWTRWIQTTVKNAEGKRRLDSPVRHELQGQSVEHVWLDRNPSNASFASTHSNESTDSVWSANVYQKSSNDSRKSRPQSPVWYG